MSGNQPTSPFAVTCIRPIDELDLSRVVELNESEVQQTSPMDVERLRALIDMSSYARVATVECRIAAFLIAMRDDAAYDNENFRWFATRFANFLYVDRIVVGADFAGRRIGSALYDDLFEFARSRAVKSVVCEYNLEPPNPASRAFHDKFGFAEVGTQWVAQGRKKVSLQAAPA